ncbi:hypothetical protein BJV78DRAFT_376625 [Lactifluus subvellereus]|nr:hypothetical protein BJV78DRAFT_376625 [Lactifluus subvellereus]
MKNDLNPTVEITNAFDVTDKDIFEAVMDAKRLREGAAASGDDFDVPAPGPVTTRWEALQVVLTLRKYVGTFNESFARKLEVNQVMLGLFGQQTRAVEMRGMTRKDSKVTDYFPCK